MKRFLAPFLSDYRWFRKWHGGKWAYVHVDFPIASPLWLKIPDDADENYRGALWRGTPVFETY